MRDWDHFFGQLLEAVLAPGRAVFEHAGLERTEFQVFALYFALIMAFFAIRSLRRDVILKQQGTITTGHVTRIMKDSDGPDYPRIAFTDSEGREYQFTSDLACWEGTDTVGKPVEVLYDPTRPRLAQEAGRKSARDWHHVMMVLVMALGLYAALTPKLPFGWSEISTF